MNSHVARGSARRLGFAVALLVVGGVAMTFGGAGFAWAAAEPTVGLGTSATFGVLAGSTVTNTGPSTINGLNVGVSPKTAITGFPPGIITAPGTRHAADPVAKSGQSDALKAYNDAAGRSAAPRDKGLTDLVGRTLQPGVYQGNLSLSGTVTLDNRTNPDAVFIFQASSTLITASSSNVRFTTPHTSCNVFWQVASSATLGTHSRFVGTVLAHTSVTAQTGATVTGRLLAATGAVTLDSNVITAPACAAAPPSSSTPPSGTSTGPTSTPPTSVTEPTGVSTGPGTGTGTGTSTSPPGTGTSTRSSTSPSGGSTTSSTMTLLTTTTGSSTNTTGPSTTVTTTALTTGLIQPSFPTGVPGGRGPTAPLSPLRVVGAAMLLLGTGMLVLNIPAVRRRVTRWGRFLSTPANRGGDHR